MIDGIQRRKIEEIELVSNESPKSGPAGTTNQSPRWEGPQENRPGGYLPAKDDPDVDRDAVGENNQDRERKSLSDAAKTTGD